MGSHPLNLALRFLLELCALASAGYWGWKLNDGNFRYLLAIGIPILMAAVWGVFAVPEDPSRSGNTVVITPGIVRLCIEIGFFAFATWVLYDLGLFKRSFTFGLVVVIHYILSYDRISWLLKH